MDLVFLALGWLAGLWLGEVAAAGGTTGAQPDEAALLQQLTPWLVGLAGLSCLAALLSRNDRRLRITAFALALGLMGVWRAFGVAAAESGPAATGAGYVVASGTVSSRPEPRDASLLLVLDVDRLSRGGQQAAARLRVLIQTDRYTDWAYGDRVVAVGDLRPVEGGSGYWVEYLARQGIRTTMEYPRLQLESRPLGPDLRRSIDGARSRLECLCAELFPEPQASLLAGILVGARATMPADFRDALNITSTSHIVAVSGFNVTVVAGAAQMMALRVLGRRRATLLALFLVWLYSLLTGLPPSAFRAAIMATLGLSAVLFGRGGDTLAFLCFSAALMAGADPLLLHDLGFQLSFLATAGLVLLEPVLRRWLGLLPRWLAASLSVTLAAQLATLPVLVSSFNTLSLVSPLSNLLIAPALPGLMGAGAVAVALGAIAAPLGQVAAPLAWLYLTYVVEVIRWTARLPAAAAWAGAPTALQTATYYLLLLGAAIWAMPEARPVRDKAASALRCVPRWALAASLAAAASVGLLGFSARPDGRVHVYFLDVGDGDATLIRSAEGHQLLVDGGPSPSAVATALGRHLGLMDRALDAVVVTGASESRLAGLVEVARRHPIGLVLQPPALPSDHRAVRAWNELLQERGLRAVGAARGQQIPLGQGVWLEVLWAPQDAVDGTEQELALRLVANGVSVMLLGDLSRAAQAQIAHTLAGRADVLRVPGQGAAGVLDERFLQTVSPRVAVVSVRAGNRYGRPAESTLQMLRRSTLLRTDRDGTVELAIAQEGYELFTER